MQKGGVARWIKTEKADALSGCQTMCGKSVWEVAATHGNISFKDVLLFHREE